MEEITEDSAGIKNPYVVINVDGNRGLHGKFLQREDLHQYSKVDLDSGNHERFLDVMLRKDNNITTGKVYQSVLEKLLKAENLGENFQMINFVENDDGNRWHLEEFLQGEPLFQNPKVNQYGLVFYHFDENGDGKISLDEFTQCLSFTFGGIPSREFVEVAEKYLDNGGDGLLGLDEFLGFVNQSKEKDMANKLKDFFTVYDKIDLDLENHERFLDVTLRKDNNITTGKIYQSVLEKERKGDYLGEKIQVNQYEHVFNRFDENGDGKLSLAEFTQCLNFMFGGIPSPEFLGATKKYLDNDGDGLLRLDEFLWFVNLSRKKDKVNKLKDFLTLYDMVNDFVSKVSHSAEKGDGKTKKNWLADKFHQHRKTVPFQVPKANNPPTHKALNSEPSLGFSCKISSQQHWLLLTTCIGFLSYFLQTFTNPFDPKTTNTPQLLRCSEAFTAFSSEICHFTGFMICFILTWILILLLDSGVKIYTILLFIAAALLFLPGLIQKSPATGIHVVCGGSFKLSLFWFVTLCAVVFSIILGLVVCLSVYLGWTFICKGKPREEEDEEIEVSFHDFLTQITQGLN